MNTVNFFQLQLVEYGLLCIHEFYTAKKIHAEFDVPKLVIQTETDICIASTLSFNESQSLSFNEYSNSFSDGYISHNFPVGYEQHPFQIMRKKVFEEFFNESLRFSYINVLKFPEVFIGRIIELAKSINIQFDFEMPKIWYKYQSLIHGNLVLDFMIADDIEYKIISVVSHIPTN